MDQEEIRPWDLEGFRENNVSPGKGKKFAETLSRLLRIEKKIDKILLTSNIDRFHAIKCCLCNGEQVLEKESLARRYQ